MFVNPPDNLAAQRNISIAWPVDLLLSTSGSQQIVGFLMQRVAGMHPIHEFYASGSRRNISPLFNYLYLHRTAYNLAVAIRNLHNRGYVIGDVNESNILVSETSWVTLVDTDSFQVRDLTKSVVYRCSVGKPEFTPPELQGQSFRNIDRRPEHDLFGLAVLIFQLLMEGTHPFDGQFTGGGETPPLEQRIKAGHFPYGKKSVPYRPRKIAPPFEILHPKLRQLFIRCFEDGHNNPRVRPDAGNWLSVLEEAEKDLVTCSVNNQHRYGSHLRACPWCDRTKQLGGNDPFPSKHGVKLPPHLQIFPHTQQPLSPTSTAAKSPTTPVSTVVSTIALSITLIATWFNYGYPQWQGFQGLKKLSNFQTERQYENCIKQATEISRIKNILPLFYQKSQKLLSDCQARLALDASLINNAKKLATEDDFVNAIIEASKVRVENSRLYNEASSLINLWGKHILSSATEQYQKGQLQSAIIILKHIPNTSQTSRLRQEANATISQWQKDWELASKLFDAAQKDLEQQKWQAVTEAYEKLPNIQYWRYKIEPIVKIAISKKTQTEILQGERMVIDESGVWENLDPSLSGKYWKHTQGPIAWKYLYITDDFTYSNQSGREFGLRQAYWCWYIYTSEKYYDQEYRLIKICDGKFYMKQRPGKYYPVHYGVIKYYGNYDKKGKPVLNYKNQKTAPCKYERKNFWGKGGSINVCIDILTPVGFNPPVPIP